MGGNVAAVGQGRWVDEGPRARVLCITAQPALAADVRDTLATWLPGVEVTSEPPLAARWARGTDCLIAGPEPSGRAALELLREVRASGYRNGVVLLASAAASGEGRGWTGAEAREAAQLGATLHLTETLTGESLAAAVAEAVAGAHRTAGDEATVEGSCPAVTTAGGLRAELERTRQQLAAGARALQLQHAVNNPLAALLAEAQLLELEELAPEQRAAVRRIIELCRRVVVVVRELGAVRPWRT